MRYLLDELMAYEEGFNDILMADRASERHEVFMGAQSTLPISHADLRSFEANLLQRFQSMLESSPRAGAALEQHDASACKSFPSPPEIWAPSCVEGMTSAPPPDSSLPTSPRRPHYRSTPPRIPRTTSLDDAILYWETGNVEKGLLMPLKSWALVYQPSEYQSEAQKLSMISIVYEEFVHHCWAGGTRYIREGCLHTQIRSRLNYSAFLGEGREVLVQGGKS
jgi:hypothetical protein